MRTDRPTYELVQRWVNNDPELQNDEWYDKCVASSRDRLTKQAADLGLTVHMFRTQHFGQHWQVIAFCYNEVEHGL